MLNWIELHSRFASVGFGTGDSLVWHQMIDNSTVYFLTYYYYHYHYIIVVVIDRSASWIMPYENWILGYGDKQFSSLYLYVCVIVRDIMGAV